MKSGSFSFTEQIRQMDHTLRASVEFFRELFPPSFGGDPEEAPPPSYAQSQMDYGQCEETAAAIREVSRIRAELSTTTWECALCTYHNGMAATTCEMCEKVRPDEGGMFTYLPLLVSNLHRAFPRRCQGKTWRLVYSTRTDGVSIRTLLSKCEATHPILLVVTDTHNNVFGAFSGTPLRVSKLYSGSGEGFLWTTVGTETVKVFAWSRANTYYSLVHADQIAFGGGGQGFGLVLGGDLLSGVTNACATYASEPLNGSSGPFEILSVEIWGL